MTRDLCQALRMFSRAQQWLELHRQQPVDGYGSIFMRYAYFTTSYTERRTSSR